MELETVHLVALIGFIAAMIFGAVANKTHFCIMGSISDWINMGSKVRLRAWMLALGIAVLATQTMYMVSWFDIQESVYLSANLNWVGYLLGGFLFGIGMTLGAGCGQRTLVRVGGGNLKSLIVLIVLAITAYMTLRGLLALVRINAIDAFSIDLTASGFANQGMPHMLSILTGMSESSMRIVLISVISGWTFWYSFKDKTFRSSFDNILVGITVGIICASAWYVTGVIGNDDFEPVPLEGISFIAPVGNSLNYLMTYTGATINFGIAVVGGMILGSFVYAITTGNFRIETFSHRGDMINHIFAGILMGFGGVIALGCTIGQGVTGLSTLALGSLMTLISIIFGCALTLKMQYYMLDESFLNSLRQSLADLRLIPAAKQT
ncbi:MAG: membrane protein [marine bacterium B5-7]|nr:MAG: membrane protein [marine bacterium B5-7]